MRTYRFDCYHKDSKHRLRRVYSVRAEHISEALERLAELEPSAVPYRCLAESRTRHSRWALVPMEVVRNAS